MEHSLRTIEQERDQDGQWRWRWVCNCHILRRGGLGRWNYQSDNVARYAHAEHARRACR